MDFLADENFPADAVEAIRAREHNIVWVRHNAPGISDQEVFAWAASERRILITFDKDFGELTFRGDLPLPPGVILFRIPPVSPAHVAQVSVKVIESRNDWTGHFSMIEEKRIRMVPLPTRSRS